jgi:ribonuclease E
MANKMLIDSTHPEETRVVVLRGNRVEEFDFESANRRQLRGNIYLAKVTRVEPSLQAAFVDYGGNRHGFLAFSEIHPDYYQIPVADRQALIAEEERAHRDAEAEIDRRASRRWPRRGEAAERHDATRTQRAEDGDEAPAEPADAAPRLSDTLGGADVHDEHADAGESHEHHPHGEHAEAAGDHPEPTHEASKTEAEDSGSSVHVASEHPAEHAAEPAPVTHDEHATAPAAETDGNDGPSAHVSGDSTSTVTDSSNTARETAPGNGGNVTEIEEPASGENGEDEVIESVGGADALEEVQERTPRYRRSYKIQEVIKRRQIMLVQVVKEERGTKGAALTTYLSLAGRYSVLMPNTARGGGISRKITNSVDRKKLKEIAQDLEVPEGMGVILRTAGANRTKTEVKRDFEYLLRLWETVRDLTLKSTAPKLVYEEGSLIKRSIRDLYNKDIDEILVAGDDGHREARDFMRMLMPSHAKNVKLYKDTQPVFTRYGIESQLDSMFQPVMQLRSGGYIVLNQTEALVAIDVNSGRATREHHIEDTALKTNLEAADEVARQLRLRDLAGLIVIDFIDMDEKRNNRHVERRMKEALKHDRARIQVGRISHFGLLEMSRQRIRSSVLESSTDKCPHCGGTGHVRSVSSVALHLLRMLEEMLLKGATHNLLVRTRAEVALYVLNHKRAHLRDLESRFQITITVTADDSIGAAQPFLIEKGEQVHSVEAARAIVAQQTPPASPEAAEEDEADEVFEDEVEDESADVDIDVDLKQGEGESESDEQQPEAVAESEGDNEQRRGRRRRRGRGRGREGGREPREGGELPREAASEQVAAHEGDAPEAGAEHEAEAPDGERHAANGEQNGEAERRRRRRGRRGGRRNRRGREGEGEFAGRQNGGHDDQPRQDHGIEPEVADASADLGGPSRDDAPAPEPTHTQPPQPFEPVARDPEPRPERMPAPVAAEAPAPAAVSAPAEPPKRRSTVREPAPMFSSGAMSDVHPAEPASPPPAPEPVATAPEPVAANQAEAKPRRFGWWNKRG